MNAVGRRDRPPTSAAPAAAPPGNSELGTGRFSGGRLINTSGLTFSVINRARLRDGYVRVRHGRIIAAVTQFLYDEAAVLDERRLDDWLALFHPEAGKYLIPSPENLSEDPATTLHLVNDSMTTLAGRIGRLKSKHAHAESPR